MESSSSQHSRCCVPGPPTPELIAAAAPIARFHQRDLPAAERAVLHGGRFLMGTAGPEANPGDGEEFVHHVEVDGFALDVAAVTNERFRSFVDATGYTTDAERIGWSFVFGGLLPDDFPETRGVATAPWWRQVHGANWAAPEGPHSGIVDRLDHPVVHVSHDDALAFCSWDGSRLPTEAEWEYGARGHREGALFPWGDELTPGGIHHMNVWQGRFPGQNLAEDGYQGTAPARSFAPNDHGLYNMCGNVWEWCADWFHPATYRQGTRINPTGPVVGRQRVLRGGSYLCHASYCNRYRVGARSSNTPDSTAGNVGFRTVADEGPRGRPPRHEHQTAT